MSRLKAHALESRWSTGGFHKIYHVECRCGKRFDHYSAGKTYELFKTHLATENANDQTPSQ